jgi:hypothetical protein
LRSPGFTAAYTTVRLIGLTSRALHLSIFEQPAKNIESSTTVLYSAIGNPNSAFD